MPFLLLSLLTPWAKTSWIDEDSVSLGRESADIYPSSKGLSLLRTKTKSQVNKMFSTKATLVSASELHHGVPAVQDSITAEVPVTGLQTSLICTSLITAELDPAVHLSKGPF